MYRSSSLTVDTLCPQKCPLYQVCFSPQCKYNSFMCGAARCVCFNPHQKCQIIKWEHVLQNYNKKKDKVAAIVAPLQTKITDFYKKIIKLIQADFEQFNLWSSQIYLTETEITFGRYVNQAKYSHINSKMVNDLLADIRQNPQEINTLELDQELNNIYFETDDMLKKIKRIYKSVQKPKQQQSKTVLKTLRGSINLFRKKKIKDSMTLTLSARKTETEDSHKIIKSTTHDQFYFSQFNLQKYMQQNKTILELVLKSNSKLSSLDDMLCEFSKIEILDLSDSHIQPQDINIICKCNNLLSLNLCNNNIGGEGAVMISKSLRNLTYLNLCANKLTKESAKAIVVSLTKLHFLDLESNNIDNDVAREISRHSKTLTELVLNDNIIENESALLIAKNMKNLKWLQLQSNPISPETKKQIKLIFKNRSLYI